VTKEPVKRTECIIWPKKHLCSGLLNHSGVALYNLLLILMVCLAIPASSDLGYMSQCYLVSPCFT